MSAERLLRQLDGVVNNDSITLVDSPTLGGFFWVGMAMRN